jgi:hypothetical protein
MPAARPPVPCRHGRAGYCGMPAGRAAGSVLIAPETDLGFALNHLKSPYISSHQAVPLQQLNDLYGGGDGLRRAALVIQLRPRRSSSTAAAAAAARSQRRRHCARVPGCGRVVQRVAAQVVARRHVRTYQPQSPPSNNPINNPFSPLKQPFSPYAPASSNMRVSAAWPCGGGRESCRATRVGEWVAGQQP